jgi:hypothetical protein
MTGPMLATSGGPLPCSARMTVRRLAIWARRASPARISVAGSERAAYLLFGRFAPELLGQGLNHLHADLITELRHDEVEHPLAEPVDLGLPQFRAFPAAQQKQRVDLTLDQVDGSRLGK